MVVSSPPPVRSSLRVDGVLKDPDAATKLAQCIAPHLGPGDTVLLEGALGVGKTHIARGILQWQLAQHDLVEDIPSPSFTLVQTYELPDFDIWHVDLYRLTGPDQARDLGLEDAFHDALCLVEWPDRLGALAPDTAIRLSLRDLGADGRGLRLDLPDTPTGHALRHAVEGFWTS